MKEFRIIITETTIAKGEFEVQAESQDEAEEMIRESYDEGFLTVDNFMVDDERGGIEFDVEEIQ